MGLIPHPADLESTQAWFSCFTEKLFLFGVRIQGVLAFGAS
jgi:hypothetical protein